MILTFIKKLNALNIAALIAALISLALVALNIQFEGMDVKEYELSLNRSEFSSDSILLTFNRPIDTEYDHTIRVEPEVGFITQESSYRMNIVFDTPLESDSTYSIVLEDVVDIYGDGLKEPISIKFLTPPTKFYYVSSENSVIEHNLSSEDSDVVLEIDADVAKMQVVGLDVYVLKQIENVRELWLYSMRGSEESATRIYEDSPHVIDFAYDARAGFVYALVQDIYTESGVTVPFGQKHLVRYDNTQDKYVRILFGSSITSIDSFMLSPNGKSILLQEEFTNKLSLFSLSDTSQVVPLGSFVATSRFAPDGDELALVKTVIDENQLPSTLISIYNSRESYELDVSAESLYPFYIGDKIAYSRRYDEVNGQRGMYELYIHESDQVIRKEGYSLEQGVSSRDGRYLFMMGYTAEKLNEGFDFSLEPGKIPTPDTGVLMIYDLKDGEFLDFSAETSYFKL